MLDMLLLMLLPLLTSILLIFSTDFFKNLISVFSIGILFYLSVSLYYSPNFIYFSFSELIHLTFLLLDVVLLIFFLSRGFVENSKKVSLLALVQLILYSAFIFLEPSIHSNDIVIDKISLTMLLVINIVGGVIIFYALQYIESEEFSRIKKNCFIALLFFFLAVMNLIVTTNSIEIFFLCFELTTLCSYLLIRYREDTKSKQNALRALWMNQIGGVAILIVMILSTIYYDTIYFDSLLSSIDSSHVILIAIFTLAAFVKGASIPFDKWLLGAMVAPTPVSAILHSATMVKIAPYLILKLSPAFSPYISATIALFGMFVFMSASIMALSRDYFKEILGLSTIALLAFMMAIAAIGTNEAINICLILIVFHAISKALLFLQAGILEKEFHMKYLSDMNFLVDRSPLVTFLILIGFASLTLPPFGAFIGKFYSIELLIGEIIKNPIYLLSFIFMIVGSVVLTLLYFKVVTKLLSNKDTSKELEIKPISPIYAYSSMILFIFLIVGVTKSLDFSSFNIYQIVIPIVLIFFIPIVLYMLRSKKVNLVKEYNCGEKDDVELGAFYFDIKASQKTTIGVISIASMFLLVLGSLVW